MLARRMPKTMSLELTPLIDVIFLLLIFFMVTASFQKHETLQVSLPKLTESAEHVASQTITIEVNRDGQYLLNNRSYPERQALSAAMKNINDLSDQTIVIAGDESAPHSAIVALLEILGGLNVVNVNIAALSSK